MRFVGLASLMGAMVDVAYGTFETEETRLSPVVGIGNQDGLCIFENYDDSWCFFMTPPVIAIAWEWTQKWDVTTATTEKPEIKYYQWGWWPKAIGQGYLVTDLVAKNLVSIQAIGNLAKFAAAMFAEVTITGDYKACLGSGYDIEKIELEVKGTIEFWNCAMTILDDLLDFSDTWTGKNAKYLDSCSQSNGVTIRFMDQTLYAKQEKKLLWGTLDPLSLTGCWTLPTAPYPTYQGGFDYGKIAYQGIANYLGHPDFFQQ